MLDKSKFFITSERKSYYINYSPDYSIKADYFTNDRNVMFQLVAFRDTGLKKWEVSLKAPNQGYAWLPRKTEFDKHKAIKYDMPRWSSKILDQAIEFIEKNSHARHFILMDIFND